MWPPEGALSEAALALLGEAGVAWVASDEALLFHSPPVSRQSFGEGDRARLLFRPWKLTGVASPAIFFRDRVLSDRIGFSYATWDAGDAAADFVARLVSIRNAAPEAELVVPVILDGENAWETYPENGEPFLTALSDALASRSDIRVVTPSQALAETPPTPLAGLVAGSWVNGTLATWIGAPAKNRAWTLLGAAREALAGLVAAVPVVAPPEVVAGSASPAATAKAALFAAEASDWFWWFGDDHTSAQDPVFDALFRGHLASAYRAGGRPVPAALLEPVDPAHATVFEVPIRPLWPALDGGDGAGWEGAGRVKARATGTMHRGAGLVKEMLFGASASGDPLFVRLEPADASGAAAFAGHTLRIELLVPGSRDAARLRHAGRAGHRERERRAHRARKRSRGPPPARRPAHGPSRLPGASPRRDGPRRRVDPRRRLAALHPARAGVVDHAPASAAGTGLSAAAAGPPPPRRRRMPACADSPSTWGRRSPSTR